MDTIKNFIQHWSGRGYERGDAQTFWLMFLRDVLNISEPENFIDFETQVRLQHVNFIDAFLPDSKVIIEQKSVDKNLETVNAYEQAQKYTAGLPVSKHPKFIIACNFREFWIYDMEKLDAPTKILLEELPEKFHAFDFMIDPEKNKIRIELELSLKAGEIVGKIYDALKKQYIHPENDASLQSLNKLCVRLVFCLYAESSEIFSKHKIFRDYLSGSRDIRQDLIQLFETLNTPIENRDPYLADELKIFPYVNGGLFEGPIEIPKFTPEIKNLLLEEASSTFNWKGISPTIFGALFESTLHPKNRREGGMHYTSVENIHKVIDPLFLDDLRAGFKNIHGRKNLLRFQEKLANLKFFDPACGSGNFLTESFICLRRLENEVLRELFGIQIQMGALENPVKVSINQFYGVEINDFAVSVAQTALWIAELQMIQETMQIIHRDLDFLPLKSYANIVEGNALQLDWKNFLPHDLNFIMGNPPFSGARIMTAAQKADVQNIFNGWKNLGNLDYVSCWFKKSADFIADSKVRAALVATNSICQGDSVATLWKKIFSDGVHFDFAYRTFKWDSESAQKAHVHCIIIGFSCAPNDNPKIIFDGEQKIIAQNINAYLQDALNVFVESRNKPLCNVPPLLTGSQRIDDDNFIFTFDEMKDFIKREPNAKKYFRAWYGAEEFINGKKRFCLWLGDCSPNEIKKMPLAYERVKNVREYRLASKRSATRRIADKPTHFGLEVIPKTNFLLVPVISSERRRYIPIDFMSPENFCSNQVNLIPDTTLYHFGVLTSSVHMAWVRAVAGRLKSDYRYSGSIVYNNFVWCSPNEKQRAKIEEAAQKILDVRKKYPDSTLADLYDENLMPADLRAAHRKNDKAVLAAYGFDENFTESEIVAELMKLFEEARKKSRR